MTIAEYAMRFVKMSADKQQEKKLLEEFLQKKMKLIQRDFYSRLGEMQDQIADELQYTETLGFIEELHRMQNAVHKIRCGERCRKRNNNS